MQLLRQTVLYLPAQVAAPVFQLVSIVVWTYFLEPEEMGHYMLVLATQELAFLASLSWFATYALRFSPPISDVQKRKAFLGSEATLLALATILQLPAAFLLAHYLDLSHEHLLYTAGSIFAYFASRNAVSYLSERARADGNIVAYSVMQIGGPAGGFLLGLAIVSSGNVIAPDLLLGYAVAQGASVLAATMLLGGFSYLRRPDRALLKSALAYGGPLLGLSILAWAGENSLRYIVEYQAGAAAFGLLAVGWGLGRRVASFAAMLVTAAAFPLAARLMNQGNREGAFAQLRDNATLLLGLLLPATVGVWWIGADFANLFIAAAYRETTGQVLGPAVVAGAAFFIRVHASDQAALLERRFGVMAVVDIFEIVAVSGLVLWGLQTAGLAGAAWGAAAGSVAALLMSMMLSWRFCGFTLPVRPILAIGAACMIMAGTLMLLPRSTQLVPLLLTAAAGAMVYGLALSPLLARPVLGYLQRTGSRS